MIAVAAMVLALSGGAPCAVRGAGEGSGWQVPRTAHGAPRTVNDTLAALWRQGRSYAEFSAAIDARVEAWRRTEGIAVIPAEVAARARRVGAWKLLVVADDDCSDSHNVLTYIARLAEAAPNLEVRIVDQEAGRRVREAHRTPDGRAAIPTLIVLDAGFNDRGCWVERPAQLQHWFVTRGRGLMDTAATIYRREKQGWYDFDHGSSTLEEVLGVLEAARAGTPRCGIAPRP